ncbi:FUSC family protein [Glaciimonas immobilis]|uniref:Putative membrane protein YccC n=1 Tax=Glaciimonas immobilis TaxID=728004 RepID=A0A840RWC9_9BURK|nr:FUSC family protein [Glaciimonas immobilis]KAF3997578.1 FUSC family protein [Glaciimonas immobilis]MBB5200729.1 putative membrane protein YccC [Glaciimonas immobilis]
MELQFISPRKNAFLYLIKILTGSLISWYGLRAVGIAEPYWAMISLIVVTEPDIALAKLNFKARVINTINGAVVACLTLVLIGASFFSMLIALSISILVAMLLHNYPANWRLGPATVVILMSAAVEGTGLNQELSLALLRVGEVLAGSSVALLQTLAYGYIIKRATNEEKELP